MNKFTQSTNDYLREKVMSDPESMSQSEKEYFDLDCRNAAASLVGRFKGRGGAFIVRATQLAAEMGQEILEQEMKKAGKAPRQETQPKPSQEPLRAGEVSYFNVGARLWGNDNE